jgi:hypothetical protein
MQRFTIPLSHTSNWSWVFGNGKLFANAIYCCHDKKFQAHRGLQRIPYQANTCLLWAFSASSFAPAISCLFEPNIFIPPTFTPHHFIIHCEVAILFETPTISYYAREQLRFAVEAKLV